MERDNGWESGAEDLWLAVIVQAVADLRGNQFSSETIRYRLITRAARQWFQSSNGNPGGFVWICNILGLEPQWVRRLALGAVAPALPTTPRDTSPLHPQSERNFSTRWS